MRFPVEMGVRLERGSVNSLMLCQGESNLPGIATLGMHIGNALYTMVGGTRYRSTNGRLIHQSSVKWFEATKNQRSKSVRVANNRS